MEGPGQEALAGLGLGQDLPYQLFSDIRQVEIFQLVLVSPQCIFSVPTGAEFPTLHSTDKINQHVMELNSSCGVGENPVKDTRDFDSFDLESRLFEHFASNSLLESLAEFQYATGERPFALEGFGATANQEDAAAVNDYGTDADDGTVWILAFEGGS
jgi:hypothetical protein